MTSLLDKFKLSNFLRDRLVAGRLVLAQVAGVRIPVPQLLSLIYAPVAQLDRAFGYGPKGWGFESSRAYWISPLLWGVFIMARSSSGLGRWPLTPVTRVRIPYALLFQALQIGIKRNSVLISSYQQYMHEAIKEARKALKNDDVPIGAVVVNHNKIIGRGYNQVELLKDPTAHAEMIAITSATATVGEKWLRDATMYVTVEPCAMCAGASVLARLNKVVYGVTDVKTGAHSSLFNLLNDPRLNHRIEVVPGVMKEECAALMYDFFESLRENKE